MNEIKEYTEKMFEDIKYIVVYSKTEDYELLKNTKSKELSK